MEENKEVLETSGNQNNTDKGGINYFLVFVFFSLILVISSSIYNLFIKKDYDFLVETSCDNLSEVCFYRDCTSGECPPNNLSFYKQYHIRAYEFEKCGNEDCTSYCSISNTCEPVLCTNQDIQDGICIEPIPEEIIIEENILEEVIEDLE